MRRLLALALLLTPAFAGAVEPAASPAPAATPEERESPDWYTESSVFGRSTNLPDNRAFGESAVGNVPIVGTNAAGEFVDVRNGRSLTVDEANAAIAANDLGGEGLGVTVLHAEVDGSKGLTKGKFTDGSREIAKGTLGKVSIDAASAWGYASTGVAIGTDGVRAGAVTGGTLTLVGVSGSTKTAGFGKKDARVKGAAEALGYAMLGVDGSAGAIARVGRDAVAVGARVGAFIGASAGLSGVGELDVAGVALRIFAGASAGYGLGGNAAAFFKLDWANMAVRLGGSALAAFGPSAGAFVDIELSIAGLMKKLGVNTAIADGVKKVASIVKNAAARVATFFGATRKATGAGTARDADTKPPTAIEPAETAQASGAGIARD